ncbi:MAG TPA: hypothetical protein VMZ71_04020, partial [Gemmataceae bacterium]|nr:hypothetical protein [Gemmataceae bacterium]
VVSAAGLVVDALPAVGTAAPIAAAAVVDEFSMDDDPVVSPKRGRGARAGRSYGGGGLDGIGGVPTILFALGTFLVIFFTFMPIIGAAAVERAKVGVEKLTAERDQKIKNLLPKGKQLQDLTTDEQKKYNDDRTKINDDYAKRLTEASEEANSVRISNVRSVWLERYGLMFGFLFLSFGCIGYLRSQQPLTLRIVAAVVLGGALLFIFVSALSGCGGGSSGGPKMPLG